MKPSALTRSNACCHLNEYYKHLNTLSVRESSVFVIRSHDTNITVSKKYKCLGLEYKPSLESKI